MDNGKSRGRKKIVFQMLVMVCILAIAGYFMQAKMMEFLNRTLEESFARQAADMAIAAEERFDRELNALRYVSRCIEDTERVFENERDVLVNKLKRDDERVLAGLVSIDGSRITGDEIPYADFKHLSEVFRGQQVVDYNPRTGLLFAVPVMRGRNVTAALFRVYDSSMLTDLFGMETYHNEGADSGTRSPGGGKVERCLWHDYCALSGLQYFGHGLFPESYYHGRLSGNPPAVI